MAFYRFARASRQVLVNFLRAYLGEETKHWDGTDWIELPAIHVMDKREYDERTLPSIVTDSVTGNIRTLSFSHIIGQWQDVSSIYGPRDTVYRVYGGRGDFDVTISCAANDQDLQQKITDVATVYLTIGRGWLWNYRHILIRDVRILGDGVDERVPPEPVYYANLVVPVTADWRILVAGETLERIDLDLELVTPDDPFEDPNSLPPGTFTPLDQNPMVAVFDQSANPFGAQTDGSTPDKRPDKRPTLRPMKTPYGRHPR